MKKVLVCMLDRKVGFGDPSAQINEEVAIRQFGFAVNNSQMPSYAPADFELYKIGTYDDANGSIETFEKPIMIASGLELIGK